MKGIHGRIGEYVYQVQKGQQTKMSMLKSYKENVGRATE